MKSTTKYLLFILGFICINCSEKTNSDRPSHPGGAVRIALNAAIEDIFPITTDEINVDQIHRYMLSPSFVLFDVEGDVQPDLANGWQIGKQNQSVTFILNPKITWSNGRSVNTSDVRFTFDLINSEQIGSFFRDRTRFIKELQIIDSLTCRFTFFNPVSDPLYFTNFPILPEELESYQETLTELKTQYINQFIGCGPFVLNSFSADSLVLSRNVYYPYNYPFLDLVIFKFVKSSDQLKKMIEERNIEVVANLPLDLVVNKKYLESFNILSYPERGYTFIGWNLKKTIFKNRQMRLALSYAIDKQTIVDGILGGYSEIVNGPIYGRKNISEANLPDWTFNPVRAESLFNSLGWFISETDGIRRKQGRKLTFDLMVNKENKERRDCAINIKSNLRSVGVDLQLEFVSWKQILENIRLKKFDAILLTWTDGDHYDPSQLFHSSAIKKGLNFMSYSSAISDSLIDGAIKAWDKKQKRYYWRQFQAQIAKDMPCTFLFSQNMLIGCDKNLKNVKVDERGFLVNVREWWLDTTSEIIQ